MIRSLFVLTLPLLACLSAHSQGTEDSPEWEKLKASASKFVEAYNAKDAGTLAALVTPDAEMIRDDGARISGREAIKAFYEEVFLRSPGAQVALEATSVRFLTPNLAIEDGALHISEDEDGDPASFLYTLLHARQDDGSWLMAQSRDREVADLAAHEALADVDGLVGDWVAQTPGGSFKMSFIWDDSGSFLLGKAVISTAGLEPATATMRIGWDSVQKRIASWVFDSKGGHAKAVWTDVGDEWVVRTSGYTSEGELTSSTQILQPRSDDSFDWAITDKLIGDEAHPDVTLRMVRRPPQPNLSTK